MSALVELARAVEREMVAQDAKATKGRATIQCDGFTLIVEGMTHRAYWSVRKLASRGGDWSATDRRSAAAEELSLHASKDD